WERSPEGRRYLAGQTNPHGFRVVNYASADRRGGPFMDVIRHRGFLPNRKARFCSTEMKKRTTERYLASVGWRKGGYTSVVGFRADEPKRIRDWLADPANEAGVFPLHAAGVTAADVTAYWARQPFDLEM